MKIYMVNWKKINWDAYYAVGYNYIIKSGTYYAVSRDIALKNLPIAEGEGKYNIAEVEVLEG